MARVLIVDDDVALRQALAKHLELAGHQARQAAHGDDGIRAFQREPADVVIVDIFMPGQGGLQTIGRLRQDWPEVKIVAMSGSTKAGPLDVKQYALTLGADHFLGKPFEVGELLALIATLLDERRPGT